MSERMYELILIDAEPPTPEGRAALCAGLQQGLRLRPQVAEALMKRLPVTIRQDLSRDAAERLLKVLIAVGANAEIREQPQVESSGDSKAAASSKQGPAGFAGAGQNSAGAPSAANGGLGQDAAAPDTAPTDSAISLARLREDKKLLVGLAVLLILGIVYFLLRPDAEERIESKKEISTLLAKQKEILGTDSDKKETKPENVVHHWSGALKDGPISTNAKFQTQGDKLISVELDISAEQIEKPTDQEIIAKVSKPWLERFACDAFRPGSLAALSGQPAQAPAASETAPSPASAASPVQPPAGGAGSDLGSLADAASPLTLNGTGRVYLVDGQEHRRMLAPVQLTIDPRTSSDTLSGSWLVLSGEQPDTNLPALVQRLPNGYAVFAAGRLTAVREPDPIMTPPPVKRTHTKKKPAEDPKKRKKAAKKKPPKPKGGAKGDEAGLGKILDD